MSAITFTIDGKTVAGEAGQTILAVADAAGIYIPRLCACPGLKPHGSCRMCSVRVNGRIQAACVQTISEGIIVENASAELHAFRRDILDMLFVEGNHFCMFCEKSGLCELQALAYRHGITAPGFPYQNQTRAIDLSHPDVFLDHNRCILCGRCVRTSQELDRKNVFQFVGRGKDKKVQVNAAALAATDLKVTDQAVTACPVGALMKKRVGYAVPLGQRAFDAQPIGTEVESKQ